MSEHIDNSRVRQEALKQLILDLHAGANLEDIRGRFRALVGSVSAVEIAQMEQALINEGLPVEEVRALCDVHVSVFQEGLTDDSPPEMTPGHPVHTFKYENYAANELLQLLDESMAALPDEGALKSARAFATQLAEINKTYSRKENLLFPFLEKHGVSGPSSVMWATHDDIRARIKDLRQSLEHGDIDRACSVFGPLKTAIEQMFYKEENILYPTALKVLTEEEWVAIRDQSDEIGYCLIRPGDQWRPSVAPAVEQAAIPTYSRPGGGASLPLDTGALTPEVVNLLLKSLPVDVTYVDAEDTVRYYSEGRQGRIFTRTPAVIGRKVQNCHPPHSVHVVNRILDEMRAGERDTADFWITMNGRFITIGYVALRDAGGKYHGVIEITQDATDLRALTGEKRLLDQGQ
ncbi:MAG: DUF438 domain-containing protein [Anaerolineae bacterium]